MQYACSAAEFLLGALVDVYYAARSRAKLEVVCEREPWRSTCLTSRSTPTIIGVMVGRRAAAFASMSRGRATTTPSRPGLGVAPWGRITRSSSRRRSSRPTSHRGSPTSWGARSPGMRHSIRRKSAELTRCRGLVIGAGSSNNAMQRTRLAAGR